MLINAGQITAMAASLRETFIRQHAVELADQFPEWPARQALDPEGAVRQWVNYGYTHRIFKEDHLHQLLHLAIEHDLSIPLPKPLEACLTARNKPEARRMEQFMLSLISGNYRLRTITLEEE